jgi:hypothetical protein
LTVIHNQSQVNGLTINDCGERVGGYLGPAMEHVEPAVAAERGFSLYPAAIALAAALACIAVLIIADFTPSPPQSETMIAAASTIRVVYLAGASVTPTADFSSN